MAKFTVSIKSRLNSLFAMFNPTAESVNCSLLLKNLEKHFCDLTYKKKNFVKHVESSPQHLLEKFIDYQYRFKKLRFVDYRYHPEHF